MIGPLLRSGHLAGFHPLGAVGNPVYLAAAQLRAAIGRRLGPELADTFAVPQRNEDGDTIDWYAPKAGRVVPWSAAAADERAAAEAQLREVRTRIEACAQAMETEADPERQVFGRLLAHVTSFPDEGHIYLVDGRPVVTFWGFVRGEAAVGSDPLVNLDLHAAPPVTPPSQERRRGVPWWAWLLGLLALLAIAWFALRAYPPVAVSIPAWQPDSRVHPTEPQGGPATDASAPHAVRAPDAVQAWDQVVDRVSTRTEGTGLQINHTLVDRRVEHGDASGASVPGGAAVDQDLLGEAGSAAIQGIADADLRGAPPGPEGSASLAAGPAAEPEKGAPAEVTEFPLGGPGQSEPAAPDAGKADAEPPAKSPDDPGAASRAVPESGTGSDPESQPESKPGPESKPDGAPPQQPEPPAESPQGESQPPLGKPGEETTAKDADAGRATGDPAMTDAAKAWGAKPDPTQAGRPDPQASAGRGGAGAGPAPARWLSSGWRTATALQDPKTGLPIQMEYQLKDGAGRVRLKRHDGSVCESGAAALLQDGKLVIDISGNIVCADGTNFGRPRIECQPGADGKPRCQGRYPNGKSFVIDMREQGP